MPADNPHTDGFISLPYRLAEQFALHTNRCLFITGKAGTGKTTFLKKLRDISPKSMAVAASTGVAAINAGGMTIHSLFQLPVRTLYPTPQSYKKLFAEQRMTERKRTMLYHLEMLVIDEISMVRADVLDAVDMVLRRYKYRKDQPFGGVQVVMIGDLYQLSPVVQQEEERELARYYNGPYFFQSNVMRQLNPVYIELNHIFRQQDEKFVRLLNEVRENSLTEEGRQLLASRYKPDFQNRADDFHITLTTHNHLADTLNQAELDKLPGQVRTFKANVQGSFPENSYPADEQLTLKIGARVMFLRNDDQNPRRFYNGKQGVVIGFEDGKILVQCDKEEIKTEKMKWENIRYYEDEKTGDIKEETLGCFIQYPLRLAWSITIHKSQGLTFDRVIIDANRAFAAGQVYVALSRCRTLEGLVLSSPLTNVPLQNDRRVVEYTCNQITAEETEQRLPNARMEYRLQLFNSLFDLSRTNNLITQLQNKVAESVSFNPQTRPFLNQLQERCTPLLPVTDKFRAQLTKILLAGNVPLLHQRLTAAAGYFSPILNEIADNISHHPCRCKNKADAEDFQILITDLYLSVTLALHLIDAVAQNAATEHFLEEKSRFCAPAMNVTNIVEQPPKKQKPDTYSITLEMHKEGLTVKQIAQRRGVTCDTIYKHLARLIQQNRISISDFVPQETVNKVHSVRNRLQETNSLKDLFLALNEKIEYGILQLITAHLDRNRNDSSR